MARVGGPEILIIAVVVGVLWVMGVMKLFQKGHTTMGWIAIVGIIVPFVGVVGFAGWFVQERSTTT